MPPASGRVRAWTPTRQPGWSPALLVLAQFSPQFLMASDRNRLLDMRGLGMNVERDPVVFTDGLDGGFGGHGT